LQNGLLIVQEFHYLQKQGIIKTLNGKNTKKKIKKSRKLSLLSFVIASSPVDVEFNP